MIKSGLLSLAFVPILINADGVCECGHRKRPEVRIFNGREAGVSEFPWQVGLVHAENASLVPFCGGTLVSDSWIVTAAYCNEEGLEDWGRVSLGEHDVSKTGETEQVTMDILQIIVHPHYDDLNDDFDIMLIRISPIDFERYPHIRPACLPRDSSDDYQGDFAWVSGWGETGEMAEEGTTSTLRKTGQQVMSNVECSRHFDYYEITDAMMCASEASSSICFYDLGGPMVHQRDGSEQYELIGVASWIDWRSGCDNLGVYARVTVVLDWILDHIEGSEKCDGVDECTDADMDLMYNAVRFGVLSKVEELVENHSCCHHDEAPSYGQTPFFLSMAMGRAEIFHYLWGSSCEDKPTPSARTFSPTYKPTIRGGFVVTRGHEFCQVTADGCVWDGSGSYGEEEYCQFHFDGTATIWAETFDIEYDAECEYDYLMVEFNYPRPGNHKNGWYVYCGSRFDGFSVSGRTNFQFRTDHSVNGHGFKICASSASPRANESGPVLLV